MHLSAATRHQVSAWLIITDGSNMFFALSLKDLKSCGFLLLQTTYNFSISWVVYFFH
jgi:hypothetical protein